MAKMATVSLFVTVTACGGGGSGSSTSSVSGVEAQAAAAPEISWYSSAQPLLERYCVSCHTDGGPSPFPLETYDQVYAKRSAIAYVLEADTMPLPGFTDLEPEEVTTLLSWLQAGAPEGDESQIPLSEAVSGFTYHGDTRAVIEEYCVGCHVEGGVAPFPLDTYERVKAYAPAAFFAVENGTMPPWPPTPGYSRFAHERVIPPEDEFALLNWLKGDLAEGDPADYVPPGSKEEEEEREPTVYNHKLPLPQPYTPTQRPDDHRCFAIDWPEDEFSYVTAVTVIPDQLAEVHHVIVNIVEPKDVHHYLGADGQDGSPGWPCLLSGGMPGAPLPRQIGGWVPGTPGGGSIEGTGMGIQPGSLLVVQMHYNTLVAEPTPDQSTVLIATTDQVERPSSGFLFTDPEWLNPGGMPIPAGDPEVKHSVDFSASLLALAFGGPAGVGMGDNWALHTGFLHMHTLGETGRVTLVRANGTEQVILDIADWDFNWQDTYRLEREVLVTPQDMLRLECTFDNSAANQEVSGAEPRYVEWGDGTGDEMCLTNFFMTQLKEGYDYSYDASLYIAAPTHRQQFGAGDLVPLQLLFNNFSLHEPGAHGDAGHDDSMHMDDHGGDHSAVYEGHYHVYLNTDDDAAEHLTAWDANYFYELPEDLPPGLHTLRVSLRGTDHHPLGIEQSVVIEVVDKPAVEAVQLVDVNQWTVQTAAEDSHSTHRPATVDCPDNKWYDEDGALEVETGYCNYLSLSQPASTALTKGDKLHLVLWHGNLAFDEPADAHVAVTIDGNIVWEQNIAIPTQAEIFDERVPVNFDTPPGAKVEFHLHNHGYNTWTLLQLEVER